MSKPAALVQPAAVVVKKKKNTLLTVLPVVALVAFLFGAYQIGYRVAINGFVPAVVKVDLGARPVVDDLGQFTTNLAGDGGLDYIKVDVVLSLPVAARTQLAAEPDLVQNTVLATLRSQNVLQVGGSEGMVVLKGLLAKNLDAILKGRKVYNVYFTDFIVQPG